MRVTIFGSGYVGLVTGACLADAGNHVICVDVDAAKIERLNRGEVPIHEPGLDALIKRNAEAGRIEFTTDAPRAIEHGLFHLIAEGTPRGEDGSADLRSEEHTSELQSRLHLVCRLLLEKKKKGGEYSVCTIDAATVRMME